MEQPLIFLHLMKAAGTSFNVVLSQQFDPKKIYSSYSVRPKDFAATYSGLSDDEKMKIDLIRGHFDFGFHSLISGPSTYVTFVRDPIERVISYYYYIKRYVEHPDHAEVHKKGMSLYSFATERWCQRDEISNLQTRFIAGEVDNLEPTNFLLEKAKSNIACHFPVVGIAGRFDESLLVMKAIFGWNYLSCFYPRLNVTKGRKSMKEIDVKTKDAIRERNQLDLKLFDFCAARLHEQILSQGPTFDQSVKRFSRLNLIASPLVRAKVRYLWPCLKKEKWNAGLNWRSEEL